MPHAGDVSGYGLATTPLRERRALRKKSQSVSPGIMPTFRKRRIPRAELAGSLVRRSRRPQFIQPVPGG